MSKNEPNIVENMPQVLIVEDDRTTALMLHRSVEKWGYQVFTAENGVEAMKILEEQPIRLVISDLEMPEMDGLELCRKLKERGEERYVYFIILTSSQESTLEGFDAGADDFLTKPFDPMELQARLAVGERIIRLEDDLTDKTQELESINIHLANIATTDHLMGIGNRRSFESAIVRSHAMAQRQRISYGVLMADVDHFKAYNDMYGHQQGDQILRTMADALKSTIRAGDEVFRYGGEEIIFLSSFHTPESMYLMSERVRIVIEQLALEHKGNEGGIATISFGGAVLDPLVEDATVMPWSTVVKRACGNVSAVAMQQISLAMETACKEDRVVQTKASMVELERAFEQFKEALPPTL